jgi:hypothetical protein
LQKHCNTPLHVAKDMTLAQVFLVMKQDLKLSTEEIYAKAKYIREGKQRFEKMVNEMELLIDLDSGVQTSLNLQKLLPLSAWTMLV